MPSADQRIGLPQKPLASSFKLQVAFVCVQTLQTSGPGMKHMSALVSKRWKKIHGASCRFTGTSRRNHGFFTAYVLEGCSCAFALPQGCFPLASHQASKPPMKPIQLTPALLQRAWHIQCPKHPSMPLAVGKLGFASRT